MRGLPITEKRRGAPQGATPAFRLGTPSTSAHEWKAGGRLPHIDMPDRNITFWGSDAKEFYALKGDARMQAGSDVRRCPPPFRERDKTQSILRAVCDGLWL